MKAYIVGVNLSKYTILNKISEYLKGEGFEAEEIDWLSRKNISREDISDGDVYIWVEIDGLIDCKLSMFINQNDDKSTIVNNFALLLKSIKQNKSINTNTNDTQLNENIQKQEVKCLEFVVAPENKKSSLCGINVIIENKEYFISKEDYDELYKLDEMLSKHGYKISSIVVEE